MKSPQEIRAANLFLSYRHGWRDGALHRVYRSAFESHENAEMTAEYRRGYDDGLKVFGQAMAEAEARLGYKPSILRLAENFVVAQSEVELNGVFDEIFELVNKARQSGDATECDRLLRWVIQEDVIGKLHIDVLLSSLRLTATMRQEIPIWPTALEGITGELSKRGANAGALLWGLTT